MIPLIHASYVSPICFEYLLKEACDDYDIENAHKLSLLSILLIKGKYDYASHILERGANIDMVSSKGMTSLHEMVERLL